MEMKDGFAKFKNFNRAIKIPFVVYADFEAITKEVSGGKKT